MQGLIPRFLLASLLSVASLAAQRTWIVDANARPGYDFRVLSRAVANAHHGDLIRVRAGRYASGLSIDKGVSILGEPGVVLVLERPFVGYPDPLRLERIPKGCRLVLKDLEVENPAKNWHSFPILLAQNNLGEIHIDQVVVRGHLGGKGHVQERSLDVRDGPLVTLSRCRFEGQVRIQGARVDVHGGTYRGADATTGDSLYEALPGQAAFLVDQGAHLDLDQVLVQGGHGGTDRVLRPLASGPGLCVLTGQILIRGSGSMIVAGQKAKAPMPAIQGEPGSRLVLDPAAILTPWQQDLPCGGFTQGAVLVRKLPALHLRVAAERGRVFFADFRSQKRKPYVVFMGLAQGGSRLLGPLTTQENVLELDPVALVALSWGIQSGTGHSVVAMPIPAMAPLSGVPLAFQGFSLGSNGLSASNLLVSIPS